MEDGVSPRQVTCASNNKKDIPDKDSLYWPWPDPEDRTLREVVYLGCTISSSLDWCPDISKISSIASKTIGFLHLNLNIILQEHQ